MPLDFLKYVSYCTSRNALCSTHRRLPILVTSGNNVLLVWYRAHLRYRFFMSGYLALGYEMCTEYTYPESENISAGILNIANSIYGIILIITFGILLNIYGDIPVHVGFCLILLLGLISTVLTKDEQRRQDARKKAQYNQIERTEKNNVDGIPRSNPLTNNVWIR